MISMASPTLILTIFTSAILVVSAAAVAATRWCVPRAQDTAEGDVELAELSATLPGGAPEHMIPAGGVPPLTTTHQNGAPPVPDESSGTSRQSGESVWSATCSASTTDGELNVPLTNLINLRRDADRRTYHPDKRYRLKDGVQRTSKRAASANCPTVEKKRTHRVVRIRKFDELGNVSFKPLNSGRGWVQPQQEMAEQEAAEEGRGPAPFS